MERSRRQQIESIFHRIAEVPEDRRVEALRRACGEDGDLRAEVERLLGASDDVMGEFLERGALDRPRLEECEIPMMAESVGPYRIVRKIGEGGMGAVYEARQDYPNRTVALKVLRPGNIKRELIRRFEHEAHILAQLRHPGIAQIYDAGFAMIDGRRLPYLAMELIDSGNLVEYVMSHRLTIDERLALVADICDAVQHAHQKGIIHRDLKPNNILMAAGETARPKILDFGIARVTDADLQSVTLQTETGQILGTLAYMSPEQVTERSSDIDVRCDIYALGVILYQLLCGKRPLDIDNKSVPEAARIITEVEPVRLGAVDPALRGDIETIVSKAIDKDRERRYQSAADLARDIRRYQSNEPITAHPPSAFYHLRKFARRNKRFVAVLVISIVALMIATVLTTRFALREAEQRRIADRGSYRANLLAAQMALRTGDAIATRGFLDQIPTNRQETWEWRHLASILDAGDETIAAHDAPVTSIAFSPDGTLLASSAANGSVRIWDFNRRALIDEFLEHGDAVSQVTFRPDGKQLASVSNDGTIRVWDVDSHEALLVLEAGTNVPRGADYSPDGSRLAATYDNQQIRIWDAKDGQVLASTTLTGDAPVTAVRFIRGGESLVIGGHRCVYHWTTDSDDSPTLHAGPLDFHPADIAVSPQSRQFATACRDKTVVLWDQSTLTPQHRILEHNRRVTSVAFDPTGRMLASASADQSVRLWDATTAKGIAELLGHREAVNTIAFTPAGDWLASGSDDKSIRLWNINRNRTTDSNRILRGHTSFVYDVAFDPSDSEGRRLASAAWDGTVRIWDAATGDTIRVTDTSREYALCVAYSPDGRWLATGSSLNTISLWNGKTGERVREFALASGHVVAIDFSPDGEWIVGCDARVNQIPVTGSAVVWKVSTGDEVARYEQSGQYLSAASPDGLRIAQWDDDAIRLLDAMSGETICRIAGHHGEINRVSYSIDGRTLLTAAADGDVGVWDAMTGDSIARLSGHTDKVYDAVYSPDGTRIATCSNDNTVRIWDAETYEEMLELRGHFRYVHALSFSPDGTMLISASGDHTLRVWDTVPRRNRHARPMRSITHTR